MFASNGPGRATFRMQNLILVTGGAGFIGSNFILQQMQDESVSILNLDKLTYAGNLHNLDSIALHRRYEFIHGDIGDRDVVRQLLENHRRVRMWISGREGTSNAPSEG